MLLLIGSKALALRAPYAIQRDPKDVDAIGTFDDVNAFLNAKRTRFGSILPAQAGKKMIAHGDKPYEFELAWPGGSAAELLRLASQDPDTVLVTTNELGQVLLPSLDVLYALKMSHRYLKNSPHFKKTMMDIRHLRAAGARISDRYRDWLKQREKETYTYKHPNLSVMKTDFFKGDGVKYVYDHDTIHLAMAIHERPAYTYFQKDGAQVAVDRDKWAALPFEYKIASVLEESYVLALERSQIPHPGVLTPRQSFEKALEKVCTSITSGWWREFAWENYFEATKRYDDTYLDRFKAAVETGIVKKLEAA